jgi:TolA-binding protein
MRKVLAAALTLALCSSIWLAADDTVKKPPVRKQATTSSAQKLQQMQIQMEKQKEQIDKLLLQLQQSHEALQQAQEKVQARAQQTSQQAQIAQQQAVAVDQKANGLNHQVTEMPMTLGNVEQKPQAK